MVLKAELLSFCAFHGASFGGIADLEPFRTRLTVLPADLLDPYHVAISLAVRLDDGIIEGITDGPTPDYSRHCRDVNLALDRLSAEVVRWLGRQGYRAQAIPASHWIDTRALLGNISHKAVARMAGIGWQGKSLLLVNRQCGPRLRLTTVLTDMPLEPDSPVKNLCGACASCADACPAGAIRNVSTESHYESREAAVHLNRCYAKLSDFKEMQGIGYTFCGVCIAVCPYGKKGSTETEESSIITTK